MGSDVTDAIIESNIETKYNVLEMIQCVFLLYSTYNSFIKP